MILVIMFNCVVLIFGTRLVLSQTISCPAGFQAAPDGCVQCPSGTYSAGGQQPDCTVCPEGTISKAGAQVCYTEPCPAGEYRSSSQNECIACEGNYYSDVGAESCRQCEGGTVANLNHDGCDPCGAGTYRDSSLDECTTCGTNEISGVGAESCTSCEAGTVANSDHTVCGASETISCPAGFQAAPDGCVQCPSGTYSAGGQQPDCTACPEGTTSPAGAQVCHQSCEPGYHLEAGCATCPAGTYSPSGDSCITCPDGATSEPGSRSEEACVLQCSGLPLEWSNIGTGAEFPVTSGTMIRVSCNEGYVADGGDSEVTCVEGTTFRYVLDLVVCTETQELGPDWTILEPFTKKKHSFDPVTTTLQLHFTQLKTLRNLKFSLFTRFYRNGSNKEAGNVRVFYHMSGEKVKTSRLTLGVRDSDNDMVYCQDWRTLQKTIPLTMTYDIVSENVVTVNSASTALFKELGCEGYGTWANLVESNSIAKVMIYLGDQNRNIRQRLLIHHRFVERSVPTIPPTALPTTSPTLGPDNIELEELESPKSLCSIYPMGVFDNFSNVSAYYDVSCTHVLAGNYLPVEGSSWGWFIYGEFDLYQGKKALASMTFFPGAKGVFVVQRGWMINVDGKKFKIMEGEERAVGETGCSVLFEKLHIKISCQPLFPFVAYYDGLMAGHIQLPTTEPMKGRGSVGLCYDANSGGSRKNWQIGETEGECSVSPGEMLRCAAPPDVCVAEEYCDAAGRVSCQELYCSNSTVPGQVQLCSLDIARDMKCSLLDEVTVSASSACPDDVCLWKFKTLGAGCPQDSFFTGCPIENYL